MLVLAIATFTDPTKIGPYVQEELAGLHAFRERGLTQLQYLRADGKGAIVVWNVASVEEARAHVDTLVLSRRGLMTTELIELKSP